MSMYVYKSNICIDFGVSRMTSEHNTVIEN